jgi:hypothetical protein
MAPATKSRSASSPRVIAVSSTVGRAKEAGDTLTAAARTAKRPTNQVSSATDEIRQVREQLDKANRQSPLEVVVDALTHRRGAHKHES